MQKVFLTSVPAGIPGAISSFSGADIEPVVVGAGFTAYGVPYKTDGNGKAVPVSGAGDGVKVRGFLVRAYPAQTANADGSGIASDKIGDGMRRGRMTVQNNAGTPAKDGVVYVRVAAAAAGKPIGGIEAAADAANTEVVPNAKFTGAADASGNVEIEYNI